MANNYLQFSEVIENLTPTEVEWWKREIEAVQTRIENDEDYYSPGDIELCDLNTNPHVWLYAEERGGPEVVAEIVQRFLKEHRPDAWFSLTWATYCSKLRLGKFGGGGVFVTVNNIRWSNAYEFVEDCRTEWQATEPE